MSNFYSLLRSRPRVSRVQAAVVRELLSAAGFPVPLPPHVARFFLDETGVDVETVLKRKDVEWPVLSAIACTLDLHPEFARRTPRETIGPWFITPTAIQQRMDLSGGTLDYDEARSDLVALAQYLIASSTVPRATADGCSIYRGPRPLRLSVTVAPPDTAHVFPAMIGVVGGHDGVHVTLPRDELGGFNEKDAASFAGLFLAQRYGTNSVGVGDDAVVFGVPPRTIDEMLRSYKSEKRQELQEASNYLNDALINWDHEPTEQHANSARVGALGLYQLLKRHQGAFPKLRFGEEAALRRLGESKDIAEAGRALRDEHARLMGVVSRYQNTAGPQ
jgi:hypothetical protein